MIGLRHSHDVNYTSTLVCCPAGWEGGYTYRYLEGSVWSLSMDLYTTVYCHHGENNGYCIHSFNNHKKTDI